MALGVEVESSACSQIVVAHRPRIGGNLAHSQADEAWWRGHSKAGHEVLNPCLSWALMPDEMRWIVTGFTWQAYRLCSAWISVSKHTHTHSMCTQSVIQHVFGLHTHLVLCGQFGIAMCNCCWVHSEVYQRDLQHHRWDKDSYCIKAFKAICIEWIAETNKKAKAISPLLMQGSFLQLSGWLLHEDLI